MRHTLSRSRRAATLLAFAGVALASGGCKSLRRGGPAVQQPDTIIEVENRGFPDVVLYAVTAGDPFRLGMVTGNSLAKFKLPPRFLGTGTLQFLARPIAGRAFLLPSVYVSAGDLVEVTIAATPVQSTVTVAPR